MSAILFEGLLIEIQEEIHHYAVLGGWSLKGNKIMNKQKIVNKPAFPKIAVCQIDFSETVPTAVWLAKGTFATQFAAIRHFAVSGALSDAQSSWWTFRFFVYFIFRLRGDGEREETSEQWPGGRFLLEIRGRGGERVSEEEAGAAGGGGTCAGSMSAEGRAKCFSSFGAEMPSKSYDCWPANEPV